MPSELRIGIIGAAQIAKKNALAIQDSESNCKVVAIASRTHSKAAELVAYIEKHSSISYTDASNTDEKNTDTRCSGSAIQIYGGSDAYDRLIDSDAVDAIYIPLPTRYEHSSLPYHIPPISNH